MLKRNREPFPSNYRELPLSTVENVDVNHSRRDLRFKRESYCTLPGGQKWHKKGSWDCNDLLFKVHARLIKAKIKAISEITFNTIHQLLNNFRRLKFSRNS